MANVLDTIEAVAAKDPDRPLYCFLDVDGHEVARLTRAGFQERILVIASHLRRIAALAPGDRVLVAYPPGLEMICAFFACVRAGLIPVPVAAPANHGRAAALYRMEQIAQDCQAAAVLTDDATRDLVGGHLASLHPGGRPASMIGALAWIATDTFAQRAQPTGAARSSEILFLQYTSGSTSQPKGVMVSHDNILANAGLTVDHPDAVGVSWLPQHHDMGLIGYYINCALCGGMLYGLSPASFIQRPALWLRTVSQRRATATSAPNFALEYCLRPGRPAAAEDLDLSSLKFLIVAAEPVKAAVYQRFLQAFAPHGLNPRALVTAYGLAENTLAVSSRGRRSLSVNRHALAQGRVCLTTKATQVGAATHLMSCGAPLGDTEVVVVDPLRRQGLPSDTVGEIWVAGRSKCLGYWNNALATAAVFLARRRDGTEVHGASGYLRTGDMGFFHLGELYICGRRKDMIIIRGENYFPQDMEAVIESAVAGVRGGGVAVFDLEIDGRQGLVAIVEQATARAPPDPVQIAAAVRDHIGLTLDRIVLAPAKAIPKTSSGKLRRFEARRMLLDGELSILRDHYPRRDPGATGEAASPDGPFAAVRARHGLRGDETRTLAEAGLDSLELVNFQHEFIALLTANGAGDLVDRLSFRIVQDRAIAELFGLARRFESDPATAEAQLRLLIAADEEAGPGGDRMLMAADRRLGIQPRAPNPVSTGRGASHILLTGATGFFGPFLLSSLLAQTRSRITVLVRAADPAEGGRRLRHAVEAAGPRDGDFWAAFNNRVAILPGDLERPSLGLGEGDWARLADGVDTIHHNAAQVNYLSTYETLRLANVAGTREALRLAFEGHPKVFNHMSTTFIFGWSSQEVLGEDDDNPRMEKLDFGYSQSKWVAEQLVHDARRQGLATRVFRPALITPSIDGGGANIDITMRLLAFMIKHGIWVEALNQISFLPADVTADNIVSIASSPETINRSFHVTRDDYANMADIRAIVSEMTGRHFQSFGLKAFVPEVIRRATREDPLFPLLDFLVRSIDNIGAMQFKRYDNAAYRAARDATRLGRRDPPLSDTVAGILRFLNGHGLADVRPRPGSTRFYPLEASATGSRPGRGLRSAPNIR